MSVILFDKPLTTFNYRTGNDDINIFAANLLRFRPNGSS